MKGNNLPIVQRTGKIDLNADEETVLQGIFSSYDRAAVEVEYGMGLSGCRVFRVRPVEASGVAHRPALIKVGPNELIEKEWQAYEAWVKNTLSHIAWVTSEPMIPSGSSWGGLRCELVGGGIFEVESLSQYYRHNHEIDLLWVLQKRLFPAMSRSWWLVNRADSTFQLQSDYDHLLPVNLLTSATQPYPDDEVQTVSPGRQSLNDISIGSKIRIQNFVITEVDANHGQLTLNLPRAADGKRLSSLRLRINDVPTFDHYQVGDIVDSLDGIVTDSRYSLLEAQAGKALGETVDLSQERLTLPSARALPNPLIAYQELLYAFLVVNVSTVHGDFNLENILVDPDTRDVTVIDFATVRQGHAIHDLLRLETEVVTKLIPEALNEANLPPETIVSLYEQLDLATFRRDESSEPLPPHPILEKPFTMIGAIRREARKCFFNPEDPAEYYKGLTLYLLGALKFKNLDNIPGSKATAFLCAATTTGLQSHAGDSKEAYATPVRTPGEPKPEPIGIPKTRNRRSIWLPIFVALFLLIIGAGLLYVIIGLIDGEPDPTPIAHLCAIDEKFATEIVDGPANANDLLSYFGLSNRALFEHIDELEQTFQEGNEHRGLTYIWGSPGVGKSFISRNRLSDGFPGDSCLIKLGDLFNEDAARLDFEVVHNPDLTTLGGQKGFDSLPAVAQATEYNLDSLLEAANCLQNGELVPLIIVDDIDEVHRETSNLILRSIDRFILEAPQTNHEFLHIIVVGRSEGFATWYQDPKRNDDIADFLSTYRLIGPEFKTTGDLEVLANNQYSFVLGSEVWERLKQDGTADEYVEAYVRFIQEHPSLTYSVSALAIATSITDRSRTSADDSESDLKIFIFDELLRRASDVHGRPAATNDQYRRLLEDIAVRYAGVHQVNGEGFFTVGFNDTVPVKEGTQDVGEVLVRDVLDHSGIAILNPASFATLEYRFEPVWIHPHLVDLSNQRFIPDHNYRACHQ